MFHICTILQKLRPYPITNNKSIELFRASKPFTRYSHKAKITDRSEFYLLRAEDFNSIKFIYQYRFVYRCDGGIYVFIVDYALDCKSVVMESGDFACRSEGFNNIHHHTNFQGRTYLACLSHVNMKNSF